MFCDEKGTIDVKPADETNIATSFSHPKKQKRTKQQTQEEAL
jgi:hypothetical protein